MGSALPAGPAAAPSTGAAVGAPGPSAANPAPAVPVMAGPGNTATPTPTPTTDSMAMPLADMGMDMDMAAAPGDDGMDSAATPGDGAPADGVMFADGSCCSDGDCICREDPPSALTSDNGPYGTDSYSLGGVGCVYYPTDAEPPFSAVAISDGFGGTGGCGRAQTSGWGDFYASHGIVAMIIETGSGDQPNARGRKLNGGIEGLKSENENSSSPIFGKLAGRYGTSGFSMGGGGTTYAAATDPSLKTSVALMPWGPTRSEVTVPTMVICGSSDSIASCRSHGTPAYQGMADSVPKMIVTVSSGHAGQPSSGRGMQGAWGLAFQKVYLDGDERWRDVLLSGDYDETSIQ